MSLFAHRNFRLLWIGETTSSFGTSVSSFAVPLVALTVLHASVLTVSLLTSAAWLPWVLIGLPAGAWVDRLPRRRVMIWADLISITAFGSVVVAAAFGALTIAHLLIAALSGGVAAVLFDTAYRALLPAVVDAGDLAESNAKLQGSEQLTHVAGPGAAGAIAQATSAVGGVLVDVFTFIVSAVCLWRLDVREPVVDRPARRLRHEIAEGLTLVRRDPLLRTMAIFGCSANLTLTGYQAILVVFLIHVVGLSAGATGLLLATASLGGVLGALIARRLARAVGSARAVLLSKSLSMSFGLLIPLTHRGPAVALFLLGSISVIGGVVAGNIIWSGFVQSAYPAHILGRISTSTAVINYGAIPIGAFLAGAIASAVGTRDALWILLSVQVLSSGVLLASPLRHLRDLPTAGISLARSAA